jgi:hypothetical protein
VAYLWVQFFGFFIDRLQVPARRDSYPWYLLALAINVAAALVALYGGRQRAAARGSALATDLVAEESRRPM